MRKKIASIRLKLADNYAQNQLRNFFSIGALKVLMGLSFERFEAFADKWSTTNCCLVAEKANLNHLFCATFFVTGE